MRVLVAVIVVGLSGGLWAQGVRPVADAPPAALSDLETAYVQIVSLADQLAQCQARQLESVKQFTDVQKDVVARIEKAHPGYTVDFQTGALVPKPTK